MAKKRIDELWYRVGSVERGSRWEWRDGYSRRPDGGEQPWSTKREAQRESANRGMIARFREGMR